MIKEAEAHAGEAHQLRELAEAKNQAENLVYQTEKSLKEHREALDEADAATIEGRIMELKRRARGDDLAEIKAEDRRARRGLPQARRGRVREGERRAGGVAAAATVRRARTRRGRRGRRLRGRGRRGK